MNKWRKSPTPRPAPVTPADCEAYARSLVERGLASPAILDPRAPRKYRHPTQTMEGITNDRSD